MKARACLTRLLRFQSGTLKTFPLAHYARDDLINASQYRTAVQTGTTIQSAYSWNSEVYYYQLIVFVLMVLTFCHT